MISLITKALNIHLIVGKNLVMNTSAVLLSVEALSVSSLSNKLIEQIGNAQIRMPSKFSLTTTDNTSISLRVSIFLRFILMSCCSTFPPPFFFL